MIFTENELKKWTLKSQKSQIAILLLNQCSISAVFQIVRFAGDQKSHYPRNPCIPPLNKQTTCKSRENQWRLHNKFDRIVPGFAF